MGPTNRSEITRALEDLKARGAPRADTTRWLSQALYRELRDMARGFLRGERADHTLQPTALVHEAFLRLVDQDRVEWMGRAHFLAIAAQAMRRVLVDHARRRAAEKRGGGLVRVTLSAAADVAAAPERDVLRLEEALEELSRESSRAARVVELKFYGGMTGEEIAHVLGVSPRTVKSDWAVARAWLARALEHPPA